MSRDEIKYFLIGVGGITVLAVLITVLVMFPWGESRDNDLTATVTGSFEVDLNDFLFPEAYKTVINTEYTYYREIRETWNETDVDQYWTDPRDVILLELQKENDKLIANLLAAGKLP